MSKIYSLKIENYRGIKHFEQVFGYETFIALIGRGDSGKSTILGAINAVLCPNWNLTFSDLDFYNMDVDNPINIEATMIDVPQELLSLDKFGEYYSLLNNGSIETNITNTEADQSQIVLTIKLVVDNTLEPKWFVTSGRAEQDDVIISANDRAKFNMFMLADYVDNHFSYNRISPLHVLLKKKLNNASAPEQKLVEIKRKISEVISTVDNLKEFDAALGDIIKSARNWGLNIDNLKTSFDVIDKSYTESNISLHKDLLPYRLHGKGSKRLLSMAIQNELTKSGGIILIDEIEQGLEPDRIVNLVHTLKGNKQGQIFITTHSSFALVESNYNNLFLMKEGEDKLITFDENSQSILRTQPDAFFAQKILCCEGKTEVGVIRAINDYLQATYDISFSALGIYIANCKGGTNVIDHPLALKNADFNVCAFFDADVKNIIEKVHLLDENNIEYAMCASGLCLEQQVFNDIPWDKMDKLLRLAAVLNPTDSIDSLKPEFIDSLNKNTDAKEQNKIRGKVGNDAKQQSWFKNMDKGAHFGAFLIDSYIDLDENCQLFKELNTLKTWIGVDSLKTKED